MDLNYYLKKFDEVLSMQEFDEKYIDYSGLEKHLGLLKQLAIVENSSITIIDVYKKNYILIRSKYTDLWNKNEDEILKQGPKTFFSIMHPSDISFSVESSYLATEFFIKLPFEERKNYKAIYDYRLRDVNNKYRHFVHQLIPLELDKKGNIWLMLIINDMLPEKDNFAGQQRRMVNIKTGETFLFNKDKKNDANSFLTKREIEVLGLIAKGMASKQVADQLFLSINTVNNHRRNILEKTNTENIAEAVRYAINLGLM